MPNYPFQNPVQALLQLRVLLDQLLQSEPRELYRNLGVFPISFSLVDRALAIFRMANALARAETTSSPWALRPAVFGRVNFLPREAKKSAMLSMEL